MVTMILALALISAYRYRVRKDIKERRSRMAQYNHEIIGM